MDKKIEEEENCRVREKKEWEIEDIIDDSMGIEEYWLETAYKKLENISENDPYINFVRFVKVATDMRLLRRKTDEAVLSELFARVWSSACYTIGPEYQLFKVNSSEVINEIRRILRWFGYPMSLEWDLWPYTVGCLKADIALSKESTLDNVLVYYAYLAGLWIWMNQIRISGPNILRPWLEWNNVDNMDCY